MTTSPHDDNWFSDIETPLKIDSDAEIQWHHSADVVVVGSGAAGICCALEARENGASVIVVERFNGGGDTALSGGVIYAGGGTRFQKDAGYPDNPDNMFNYLQQEVQDIVAAQTLQKFCLESVGNLEWLEKNGVVFKSSLSPVKTSYPQKKYYLYYSGNESVPSYAEHADPVPRGHRAVGKGLSGAAFYNPLYASAVEKGAEMLKQSRVVRFVVDKNNTILGLEVCAVVPHMRAQHRKLQNAINRCRTYLPFLIARYRKKIAAIEAHSVQKIYVRAYKGVVLSCGGFVMNRKMLAEYAPAYSRGLPLGTTGANGSGIRLGQTLNADMMHMSNVSAWRFINPPQVWVQGMLVNAHGLRYVNEQCYGAVIGRKMCEEQQGKTYLILNRQLLLKGIGQALFGRIWFFQALPILLTTLFAVKKAASIEMLAEKMAVSVQNLRETLAAYNAAAQGKQQDLMHKEQMFMCTMEAGPYYALDMSIDSKTFPLPTITLGGLRVAEHSGLVKDLQGREIAKLYAAGRTAVGIASNMYISGLSIADCVFSGRRAGKHVAQALSDL